MAQCLSLPSPSSFAANWTDFQDPDFGTPIVKCLRPSSEQEASAALVFTPFGQFLDLVSDPQCRVDSQSSKAAISLIRILSESYANTAKKTCLNVTQKFFGKGHQGKARGSEERRAELLRDTLMTFFAPLCPTLSPSSLTQVSSIVLFHQSNI